MISGNPGRSLDSWAQQTCILERKPIEKGWDIYSANRNFLKNPTNRNDFPLKQKILMFSKNYATSQL